MAEPVYQNRDNMIVGELLEDGEIPQNAITRVQVRIGPVCLDSSVDADKVILSGNIVGLRLGHEGLQAGTQRVWITAWDTQHPNGVAWDEFFVTVKPWDACG